MISKRDHSHRGSALEGRRIVNTRARSQAYELSRGLRNLGAEVLEFPTIEIELEGSSSPLAYEAATIDRYSWLVFTSANAVEALCRLLMEEGRGLGALAGMRIASIGPGTSAALTSFGMSADLTAADSVGEGLIATLAAEGDWEGQRILYPMAERARDLIPKVLADWGAHVSLVTAYRTVKAPRGDDRILAEIASGNYDLITFTSPSTFVNFKGLFDDEAFADIAPVLWAATIGPITSASLRKAGIGPLVEARIHSIEGLIEAISGHCGR